MLAKIIFFHKPINEKTQKRNKKETKLSKSNEQQAKSGHLL